MIKVIWYCTSHIKSFSRQQLLDLQILGADYLGFILNNVVWMNFWDCFHDPMPASRSKVMAIQVIHLQFHFPPPPSVLRGYNTYHCMHSYVLSCMKSGDGEAILCTARLSLCYTATCYGIDECIGSCWCMGDSKYKDPILHIPTEYKQIQWRQHLLVCCFHEDYNIMACRVCINRRQNHYPNWFPLLHVYSCCQALAVDAN